MIIRKLTKAIRKYRWSFPTAEGVRLRWHIGQPNFGDDLNPYFFERLLEKPIRFSSKSKSHLLGIGSIFNTSCRDSIVVGSGLLAADMAPRTIARRIISLRGHLTAEVFGCDPGHYGDPAVLTARLFPQSTSPTYRLGVIPHHSQAKQWLATIKTDSLNGLHRSRYRRNARRNAKKSAEKLPKQDVLYIDPRWHPLRVIEAITLCQGILSQSLHGLIIADAYSIPNAWITPATTMTGKEFKFADYYSTTSAPKRAIGPESLKTLIDSTSLPLFVSPYRFDLGVYQQYLKSEIFRELLSDQGNPLQQENLTAAS